MDAAPENYLQTDDVFAAAWYGHSFRLETLLQQGAAPNEWRDGLTPLHLSAAHGGPHVADVLLRAGAVVNAEWWPAHENYLREMGPAPAITEESDWWNRVSLVTRRRFGPKADGLRAVGCTPLHLACDVGDASMVRLLLAHGADPYLEVFLDGGVEGFWDWAPRQIAQGQPGERSHIEVLAVLDDYLTGHPQSEASKALQRSRRERAPD